MQIVTISSPHADKTTAVNAVIALNGRESADVLRFERELERNPALVERILRTLPPVPAPERVTIRTDAASVDTAICEGLELAISGIETHIELESGCKPSE